MTFFLYENENADFQAKSGKGSKTIFLFVRLITDRAKESNYKLFIAIDILTYI